MPKIIREIKPIQLSADQESDLAVKLLKMEIDARDYKGDWDQLHQKYMQTYLTIPDQKVRSFPWDRASNFYAPLVRVVMDGLMSQIYDAMLSQPPRVLGFEHSDDEAAVQLSHFYFGHVWKKLISLQAVGNDWLFNTLLDGTGVVKNRWNIEMIGHRREVIEERPVTEQLPGIGRHDELDTPSQVIVDFDEIITEDMEILRRERPIIDNVPLARLYPAPGTRLGLQYPECHWFFEETFLTKEELLARKHAGYRHIDEELFSHLRLRDIEPSEEEKRENEDIDESIDLPKAAIHTYFMRLVLPGEYTMPDGSTHTQGFMSENGFPEEVVVTFLADIGKIARIVPLSRIRPDGKRPYIDNRYKRLPDFFFGMGVPSALKHMQRLTNSLFNQMVDYGTLQNLPFFFYEPGSTGLLPDMGNVKPGAFIPVNSTRGVQPNQTQGDRLFWPAAMQGVQQWWERDSAMNDFVQGKSSALPNAPRTVGQQQMNIQQANIAFARLVGLMAEPFIELFRQVHVLYQKHAPDATEFTFFNDQSGMLRKERLDRRVFLEDVDFDFELNPNREGEAQTNLQLFQILSGIPWIQQNPESMRELARQFYETIGKKNFDKIWPKDMAEMQQDPAMAQQKAIEEQIQASLPMPEPPVHEGEPEETLE